MPGGSDRGDSHDRGQRAHLSGRAAEDIAARAYVDRGYCIVARRWRGPGGEIDLILRNGAQLVFAEVKASRTHAEAAARLQPAQMQRIQRSAAHFLAQQPGGALTEARLDVVLVDGQGMAEIMENAFGQG